MCVRSALSFNSGMGPSLLRDYQVQEKFRCSPSFSLCPSPRGLAGRIITLKSGTLCVLVLPHACETTNIPFHQKTLNKHSYTHWDV